MSARATKPEAIPSPLRAAKRAAGDLELEVIRAAQCGEAGVRRGAGPTREELAEAAAALDAARGVFERLRGIWSARARAVPRPACLACARAATAGGNACGEHGEGR